MSEHTKVLNESLVSLLQTVAEAKDFTVAQAPEVLQQLLLYKTLFHGFSTLLAGLVLVVVVMLFLWANKKNEEGETNYHVVLWQHDLEPPFVLGLLISGLLGTVVFFVNGVTLLKITLAPKLYLIEYAAGLLKG